MRKFTITPLSEDIQALKEMGLDAHVSLERVTQLNRVDHDLLNAYFESRDQKSLENKITGGLIEAAPKSLPRMGTPADNKGALKLIRDRQHSANTRRMSKGDVLPGDPKKAATLDVSQVVDRVQKARKHDEFVRKANQSKSGVALKGAKAVTPDKPGSDSDFTARPAKPAKVGLFKRLKRGLGLGEAIQNFNKRLEESKR